MTGEDTKEMATMWWIFAAMSPNRYPTLFRPVTVEIDVNGSAAAASVSRACSKPRPNPSATRLTGAQHRARIDLPHGFEYKIAEVGSGSTTTFGAIELPNNTASYAQFAELHLTNEGVVRAN
ncbi:MAG: hypothetical protein AcusKO_39860 [Acuticoccus sp.]